MRGWPLTDQDLTGDGEPVLTLQALIRARMDERGWSYADLERRSSGPLRDGLTKGRWQQLGTGTRQRNFPEPENINVIAEVLEVDVTTVVLAAAKTVGVDVRFRGPDFAQLLPTGIDRLSSRMRDGLLTIIRAAVAEALAVSDDTEDDQPPDLSLEWPKADSASRRNTGG